MYIGQLILLLPLLLLFSINTSTVQIVLTLYAARYKNVTFWLVIANLLIGVIAVLMIFGENERWHAYYLLGFWSVPFSSFGVVAYLLWPRGQFDSK